MKRFFFLSCFFVLFLASSCEDNEGPISPTSDINIQFKATYDDAPLVMGETNTYENDIPLFFTRLKFYISNIVLEDENGETIEIAEVEAVDFTNINTSAAAAEEGLTINIPSIPVGNYTGISFGIGVASDLNNTKPSDYSTSHPLGETADYWSAWESYIFTKIEGKVDVAQDGSFDLGIVYHIGSDEHYRTVSFEESIEITENNSKSLSLELDLKKILAPSSSDFLDIENNSSVHSEVTLMNYLMDNFSTAFEME